MGSGKLNGYCRPCSEKNRPQQEMVKKEYSKEGPDRFRENFMEYGIRTFEQGGFFKSEYPCMSGKYGMQKEGPKK
jgi:hypothetical protein